MSTTTENLKFIYLDLVHWIERIDGKAYIILLVKIFFVGYFLEKVDAVNFAELHIAVIMGVLSVTSLLSFFYLVRIVYPRFSMKTAGPRSMIYFKHIALRWKGAFDDGVESFLAFDNNDFAEDLAGQIIHIARVSVHKYRDLRNAVIFLGIEVVLLVLLITIT